MNRCMPLTVGGGSSEPVREGHINLTVMNNPVASFLKISVMILLVPLTAGAQDVLQNSVNRESVSLNGKWHYIVDPYETGYYDYRYQPRDLMNNPGSDAFFMNAKPENRSDRVEYDFDASPVLNVPGDWNSQSEKLFYYEGTVWYKKSFDYRKPEEQNRVFIRFGAVNYRADVYLNGKKLGVHVGGFTPFSFEVTNVIRPEGNFLIVKADNRRHREAVPTLNTDWWNYGGITRDVQIIETPPTFITDYSIQLKKDDPGILEGYIALEGEGASGSEVTLAIPELQISERFTTDSKGVAAFTIPVKKLTYWKPEKPTLYGVILTCRDDSLSDLIGFRTIAVKGRDILLNGKPVFLRGISIHEENPMRGGRAWSREDAIMLLLWAKELGCNYVRLAHYPHNEQMLRMADAMGIMVWAEIPVYWTVLFGNEETYLNAENQLKELIGRDHNRASVIIWSMANETPVSEARLVFIRNLVNTARAMDPTRLVSAALEVHHDPARPNTSTITDPLSEYLDLVSFNQYTGWYTRETPEVCRRVKWEIPQDKPVVISEFGAGALQGYHGDSTTRWSEEYQEFLYRETLKMLEQIDQLRGMSPWILADFRSPRRFLPVIQDGWNRKGLISETGDRKKAFYVLQEYYRSVKTKWE
jgi:beta-glucuronidase